MKRKTKITAAAFLIGFGLFVWAYVRHQGKPMEVSNPPVVLVPKQPDLPPHEISAEEKARLEKLKAEINAKLEENNKNGKVPQPEPEPASK